MSKQQTGGAVTTAAIPPQLSDGSFNLRRPEQGKRWRRPRPNTAASDNRGNTGAAQGVQRTRHGEERGGAQGNHDPSGSAPGWIHPQF